MRGMTKWMPFKSLVGQDTYLEKFIMENSMVKRPSLSEDQCLEINSTLNSLKKGDRVHLSYFFDGEIIEKDDVFINVDTVYKKIYFKDLTLKEIDLLNIHMIG